MGALRLFLAFSVVAAHTDMNLGIGGRAAVCLFYIISGFYMSLILNRQYVGAGSVWNFYRSRYLRLWVPYVALMVVVAVAFCFSGDWHYYAQSYAAVSLPVAVTAALSNLLIWGQDLFWLVSTTADGVVLRPMGDPAFNGAALALNAPLFSVSLELYFYLLAPWILRDRRRTLGFALLGMAYHLLLTRLGITSLGYTYHVFPATVVYFGLGGVAYHLGQRPALDWVDHILIILLLALAGWTQLALPMWAVIGFAVLIPALFHVTRAWRWDRLAGELSYGVYIAHVPVLQISNKFSDDFFGLGKFWGVGIAAVAISAVLYTVVERPLTRYRHQRFLRAA